jgi:hypothetical protein
MGETRRMKVVEEFLAAKTANAADCEDGIVVTEGFAAVIDGATDKTGRRFLGLRGGRLAMLACADAVRSLEPAADVSAALAHLSASLDGRLPDSLSPGDRPSAVLAVYSQARREVWQIGDVCFWHPGLETSGNWQRKTVDRYATDLRVAVLHAELASGADPAVLARNDPGRDAIIGLLRQQGVFCNNLGAGEWAYSAINGSMVPPDLVAVYHIPLGVTELILASDGYPHVLPTLEASEQKLIQLLASDPLCIGPLRGTKAVTPGNISFDDRAYLRLAL